MQENSNYMQKNSNFDETRKKELTKELTMKKDNMQQGLIFNTNYEKFYYIFNIYFT